MSDENEVTAADTADETTAPLKPAEVKKKHSIPGDEIKAMVEGIPQYTKTSFLVVGHKNGVRLAVPLTSGVSRIYFYANDDYSLIPSDDAITVFDEADRKQHRRGGIMAEIDFEKGVDAARVALGKLVDVVKAQPAPAEKPVKTPRPKKEPKLEEAAAATEGDAPEATQA